MLTALKTRLSRAKSRRAEGWRAAYEDFIQRIACGEELSDDELSDFELASSELSLGESQVESDVQALQRLAELQRSEFAYDTEADWHAALTKLKGQRDRAEERRKSLHSEFVHLQAERQKHGATRVEAEKIRAQFTTLFRKDEEQ